MPDAKKHTSFSLYTMDDGQLPMEEIPIIHFQEGKEVEHLWMMSGKEALRFSKEKSGLTQNDIAKKLGVSLSVVNRYFNKEDSYLPSLEMIPRLCDVLGNDFLLHWMDIQLKKGEDIHRQEMLSTLTKVETAYHALRLLVEQKDIILSAPAVQEAVDKLMRECASILEMLPSNSTTNGRKRSGPPCPGRKP